MKEKFFLFLVSLFMVIFSYGQTDTVMSRVFKNEIGVDATSLLTNIFKGNYSNPFIIQYQRHIKQSAIRVVLNGLYSIDNHFLDTGSYEEHIKSIGLKLEYLHYFKLDYHWYSYFGIGVAYSNEDRLSGYPSGNYISYRNTKIDNIGGNLFMGLQYQITSRIKVSVEGDLEILKSETTRFYYYQFLVVQSGSLPSDYIETIKSTTVKFTPPIYATFSFMF